MLYSHPQLVPHMHPSSRGLPLEDLLLTFCCFLKSCNTAHQNAVYLQVYRYMYNDIIRVEDNQDAIDLQGIQVPVVLQYCSTEALYH